MKKTNKMRNMKTIKIVIIGMLIFMYTLTIVNASIVDELTQLKTQHCNLIERDTISSYLKTNLINKFELTGEGNCSFVLDYFPYSPDTLNLIEYGNLKYGKIEHILGGNLFMVNDILFGDRDYLFILGKDSSALQNMVNFTINYKNYKIFLRNSDGGVIIPEDNFFNYLISSYQEPVPDNCINNAIENIYLGNSGSYINKSGVRVPFNSECINNNLISYPFCDLNIAFISGYLCNCVQGKCIAKPSDIFNWINLLGSHEGPGSREVDSNLISSAIKSWIEN